MLSPPRERITPQRHSKGANILLAAQEVPRSTLSRRPITRSSRSLRPQVNPRVLLLGQQGGMTLREVSFQPWIALVILLQRDLICTPRTRKALFIQVMVILAGYGHASAASHNQGRPTRSHAGGQDITASSSRHPSVDVDQLTHQLGQASLQQAGSGRSRSHHLGEGTSRHGKDAHRRADPGASVQDSSSNAAQPSPVLTEQYRNWLEGLVFDPEELIAVLTQASDWKTARKMIQPRYSVSRSKADELARSYSLYTATRQTPRELRDVLSDFRQVVKNSIPKSAGRPHVATVVEYNGKQYCGTSCGHRSKSKGSMADRLHVLGLSDESLTTIRNVGRNAAHEAGNCGEVRAFGDALQAGGYEGTMRAVSSIINESETKGKPFCMMCRMMSCQLVRMYPGLKIIDILGEIEYNQETVSQIEQSIWRLQSLSAP